MTFYLNLSDKNRAEAARSAAREAKSRARPLGVSLSKYCKARKISNCKAVAHRDSPNFPKPIGVVGAHRRIKYYNEKELEVYFANAGSSLNKVKRTIVKPTTLRNKFITTNWTGMKLSKKCSLAEDGPEL